jgi:hypothetical protein
VLPNPEWREGALELIVRLVLQLYCSWWFRFVQPCECFPLKLLLMVERPPDYIDPIRQEVSKELLLTPKSELMKSKVDDISWKLVEVFKPQLQRMATTGTCSQDLYIYLLHYRGQLPGETQDLEGLNSRLLPTSRGTCNDLRRTHPCVFEASRANFRQTSLLPRIPTRSSS